MKNVLAFSLVFLSLTVLSQQRKSGYNYPEIRRTDHADEYHGEKIQDPYFWLEDENSEETKKFVEEQNKVTYSYLENIPFRSKVKERLTEIWSFASMSAPFIVKNKFFFYRNTGKQNHAVLYMKEVGKKEPAVLLDPNTFSSDGTVSMGQVAISPDAKYAAYAFSSAGSDWTEIKIKDIKTGKTLEDHIKWVKFSGISWKGNGFFYSAYDAPKDGKDYSAKNEFHKIYYHSVGTTQQKDVLIYEDKENALRNFGVSVSEDQKYIVLSGSEGTSGNNLKTADISKWKSGKEISWKAVVDGFESDFEFVGQLPSGLLFITNAKAPNNRLLLIDPKNPSQTNWKEIIPENTSVLESVTLCNGKMIAKYLEDVSSRLKVFSTEGKFEKEIELPGLGMAGGLQSSFKDSLLYYSFVSFTFPSRIMKINMKTGKSSVYFQPEIDFDSENYETKQVFFTSKDGTKIPMFITHKKGLNIDGKNPTFLFGYGGFNISYTPEFRVDRTVFLENGGIYCVANIRGGGEYGEAWHKAGTQLQKQNVFDDFIAAAEYLIKEGYTDSDHLAAHGRSNGGLLAAAVLLQRPELFKVVVPQVGVLDMLKFHKFTIGWAWTGDYGSSDNKEQFDYLKNYSPVHNVPYYCLPATLVITGDHDDRVVPAHSFKFISEVQYKSAYCNDMQGNENPLMIRIDTKGGHGSGKPLAMQIEEYSDIWSFVMYNLGMTIGN
jgi:prolyl oligopeptidase